MFSCACSLRSTRCAALIALATAAGVPRFEPVRTELAALHPTADKREASNATVPLSQICFVSIQALGSPLRAPVTIGEADRTSLTWGVAIPGTSSPPTLPVAVLTTNPFASIAAISTLRQHSHPYAVGPPRHGISSNLRAAGTHVSGDSSAREDMVARIAVSFVLFPSAQLRRTTDLGPNRAESNSDPSSALHGKLGPESIAVHRATSVRGEAYRRTPALARVAPLLS